MSLDKLRTVCYSGQGIEDMSAPGLIHQVKGSISKTKAARKSQERVNNMTPTTTETKRVQRTVFDLVAFDDVKLVKDVPMPAKPASLDEALQAVGNDKEKLLEVIYQGLSAHAADAAWNQIEGFKIVGEDGEPGEDYTGKFADEEKGKLINAAILSIAKMQGYAKDLSKEKKRELKDKATEFLRANPAMLASIQS